MSSESVDRKKRLCLGGKAKRKKFKMNATLGCLVEKARPSLGTGVLAQQAHMLDQAAMWQPRSLIMLDARHCTWTTCRSSLIIEPKLKADSNQKSRRAEETV